LFNVFGDKETSTLVSPAISSSNVNKGGSTQASASTQDLNAPQGSVLAMTKSTGMTQNPDGSRQFDLTLTIPAFNEAVFQAMALTKTLGKS
jgi:hypothetical protein